MTKANIDALVARIALRQCGVFSRAPPLAVGMTDSSSYRDFRAGPWILLHLGVYLLAGLPPSWHPRSGRAAGRRAAGDGDPPDVDPTQRFAPRRAPPDHADGPARQPSPGTRRRGPPDRRSSASSGLDHRRASGQPALGWPSSRWPRRSAGIAWGGARRPGLPPPNDLRGRRRRARPRWPGRASRVSLRSPPCSTIVRTAPFRATASSSRPCSPCWPSPGCHSPRHRSPCPAPARSMASSTPRMPTAA